jgi:hypothetical protein
LYRLDELINRPDSAAVLPAIARLTLAMLRTPLAAPSHDHASSSSSSSKGGRRCGCGHATTMPTRTTEITVAAKVARSLSSAVAHLSSHDRSRMWRPAVLQVLAQPELLQLLLLDVALAVQGTYEERAGDGVFQTPLGVQAAALLVQQDALPAARQQQGQRQGQQQQGQQQQQQGAGTLPHEQLLLALGLPAADLPVAAEVAKHAGYDPGCCFKCVVFGRCV